MFETMNPFAPMRGLRLVDRNRAYIEGVEVRRAPGIEPGVWYHMKRQPPLFPGLPPTPEMIFCGDPPRMLRQLRRRMAREKTRGRRGSRRIPLARGI